MIVTFKTADIYVFVVTVGQIPTSALTFVKVTGSVVVTTTINVQLTIHGQVTLEKYGATNCLVLKPQGYVDVTDNGVTSPSHCLVNPDLCQNGFSVSVVLRLVLPVINLTVCL